MPPPPLHFIFYFSIILCIPNQRTLDLLSDAREAIFKVERAIADEEKERVNIPMYKMRIDLAEITNRYMANLPICDYTVIRDINK